MTPFLLLALSPALQRGGSDDGAVTKVRTRIVTTDYFRKTDPAFLGTLGQLRLPRGRSFLLAGEGSLKVSPPVLKPMKGDGGGDDGGFTPIKLFPTEPDYTSIFLGLPKTKTFNASFGELAPGSSPKTGWYHTVASKGGVVTIEPVSGKTPITIAKVETFTGEIKNGEKVVENTITPSDGKKTLKVPISAGQGYRVAYTFDPAQATPGTYIKDSTIDDGRVTTMHFVAKVLAAKTYLNIDTETKPMALTAGQESKRKITFTAVSSNVANPQVTLKIANASELSAAGISASVDGTVAFGSGKTATATLKVKPDGDVLDSDGTIMVQVSEADKPVTTFPIAYSTVSAWVDGEVVQESKGMTMDAKFRYNSSGAWFYSGTCKNEYNAKDQMYSFLYFGKLVNGKHYGVTFSPNLKQGKNVQWSIGGVSKTIRDHFQEFSTGDVYACLTATYNEDQKMKSVHKFASVGN